MSHSRRSVYLEAIRHNRLFEAERSGELFAEPFFAAVDRIHRQSERIRQQVPVPWASPPTPSRAPYRAIPPPPGNYQDDDGNSDASSYYSCQTSIQESFDDADLSSRYRREGIIWPRLVPYADRVYYWTVYVAFLIPFSIRKFVFFMLWILQRSFGLLLIIPELCLRAIRFVIDRRHIITLYRLFIVSPVLFALRAGYFFIQLTKLHYRLLIVQPALFIFWAAFLLFHYTDLLQQLLFSKFIHFCFWAGNHFTRLVNLHYRLLIVQPALFIFWIAVFFLRHINTLHRILFFSPMLFCLRTAGFILRRFRQWRRRNGLLRSCLIASLLMLLLSVGTYLYIILGRLLPAAAGPAPLIALLPDASFTRCWPMQGFKGSLAILSSEPLFVEGITIEHPDKDDLVTRTLAPKDIVVYGVVNYKGGRLEDTYGKIFLGRVTYDIHRSSAIQTFTFDKLRISTFQGVLIQIESNWGDPDYTCLHRIQINGTPDM